jgi:hypothetical protein
MEENAYIISILAGGVYLFASLRLLCLASETGERPERLLGIYFAFSGVYYLTYNIPNYLGSDRWLFPVGMGIEWVYALGVFPYLMFVRNVFRPSEKWAGWIVGISSSLLLVGMVEATITRRVDAVIENPMFLLEWVGYTTPCAWVGIESILYRRGAVRRARIGVLPPTVANRYLLMGLFGGFQVLACLADLYWAYDLKLSETISHFSDALLGGTEIASVALLWLAFFPPRFYTNWITKRVVILPTSIDG